MEHGRGIDGCDCYGLLRLIYAERFQIELPDVTNYAGTDSKDAEQIGSLIDSARESDDWSPVESGEERAGDAVLIRIVGFPMHVGVVVAPGIAVHTMASPQDSVLLRYRDPRYRHIVLGFYRHISLV